MRSFMRVLAAIGLTFVALAVFAPQRMVVGQASGQDLIINYVDKLVPDQAAQTNEVRAYFSVLDDQGKPVTGLTRDAIGVSLFGQPITDFTLSASQDPMSIILVIDTSGSMNGAPLDQAKAAAKQFVDTLDGQDEVALFSFNLDVTNHTQSFTVDKGAIKNAIGALTVPKDGTGWTCLYDALYDAVTLAVKRPQGRGAIVVLSDGADIKDKKQCSQHNVGDVVDKAQTTRIPIYTIGLGQADKATLEKFADQTGGQALISPKPADLALAFEGIGRLLKEQYLLVFKTDQSGSGVLQISVTASPGAVDDEQITVIKPVKPTSIPQPPSVEFEGGSYQSSSNAFVFTVTLKSNPTTNAEIADARWYVDNGQQGVISKTQAATALVYNVVDSAGTCRIEPNPHELRIELTDQNGYKDQKSVSFAIEKEMCPTIIVSPPGTFPIWIPIAVVALVALGGVGFVMRRQSKVQTVVVQDNLSDKTEEAPAEVGLVARLRLMGGSQTADGKTELSMTTETFRIGRGPDNDLQLEEKKVSRKHAEIHFNPVMRTFTLFDRNSTGGTRVNDKFVKASSEVLTNNATIVVGSANILFEVVRGGDLTGESTGSATEDDDRTEMERP